MAKEPGFQFKTLAIANSAHCWFRLDHVSPPWPVIFAEPNLILLNGLEILNAIPL